MVFRRRNQERPEQELVFYFFGGRRKTTTITERGYQLFVTATFGMWVALLIVITFVFRFPVDIDQQDLSNTAQVAAGLSAVALAILAVVHELNAGERYLKLGLAILSFLFICSALLAGLSLLLYGSDVVFRATATIFVVLSLLAVLGAFNVGKRLGIRVYLFAPFVSPFLLFLSTPEATLPTTALLLMIGATTGLAVLLVVLIAYIVLTKYQPSPEEEFIRIATERWKQEIEDFIRAGELKEIILNILRQKREAQFAQGVPAKAWQPHSQREFLVEEDEIHADLKRHKIFEDEALIREALSGLRSDPKRVYHKYDGGYWYYVAPTAEEVCKAEEEIRSFSLVRLKMKGYSYTTPSWSQVDCGPLVVLLCQLLQYPSIIVESYLLPPCQVVLERDFEAQTVRWSVRNSDMVLYVRKSRAMERASHLIKSLEECYQKWREGVKRHLGEVSDDARGILTDVLVKWTKRRDAEEISLESLIAFLPEWRNLALQERRSRLEARLKLLGLEDFDLEWMAGKEAQIARELEEWQSKMAQQLSRLDDAVPLAMHTTQWKAEVEQLIQQIKTLMSRTLPEDLIKYVIADDALGSKLRRALIEAVESS
jgi:hypothetical protein